MVHLTKLSVAIGYVLIDGVLDAVAVRLYGEGLVLAALARDVRVVLDIANGSVVEFSRHDDGVGGGVDKYCVAESDGFG